MKTENETNIKVGCLVIPDKISSSLPLEHTAVSIHVTGPLASASVTQRFGNPLEQSADLEYLYPLPEGAAITDFSLKIGERTIRAELKEIGQAVKSYENARQAGQHAGLFEQRRENLFAVRLANVQPGEALLATVRYQQRLEYDDEGYEVVYPMGLTPKYDAAGYPEEGAGVHAPVAGRDEPVGPVEIRVTLDAGFACAEPHSPTHDLDVVRLDERRFQIQLAGEYIPDHDFIMRFASERDQLHACAWLAETNGEQYFVTSLLPPRTYEEALTTAREFIFVLDRSGSMGGEPIAQARNALRACLRTLNSTDSFRILLFDDRLEWYRPDAMPVSQVEIDRADAFLSAVGARGGTEIIAALEAAFSLEPHAERTRFVVFLTDGAVSAEQRTLDLLRKKVGRARVFTFGIGPSVNRALLKRMAGLGRGMAEFLQADEDIEGVIIRFQDRVSFPVLTDVQVNVEGGTAWDVYPANIPDLYAGQPLEVVGRVKRGDDTPVRVSLSARRGSDPVLLHADCVDMGQEEPALARLWARARIDDLLDEAALNPNKAEKIRAAVLELSMAHRIVTPYSAFVGVDEKKVRDGGNAISIQVAQPLPRGLDWHLDDPQILPMMSLSMDAKSSLLPAPAPVRAVKRGFLAHGVAQDAGEDAFKPGLSAQAETLPSRDDRDALLRWLARTQLLDGSWDHSVERTSAALLAYIRHDQTTHKGAFRVAVRRAVAWLQANEGQGSPRFLRAYALQRLALSTGLKAHAELAASAFKNLPAPLSALEKIAAGDSTSAPAPAGPVANLDDLRLAVLLELNPEVDRKNLRHDLELTWLACL